MELQINPLTTGTIVKIYNSNRGQDYVIIGQSKDEKTVVAVKNNAVTNDGGLFKQTKLYFLDLTPMFKETDPFYFVPKVKRIVGHRVLDEKFLNKAALSSLNMTWYPGNFTTKLGKILDSFETLKRKDEVYPHLTVPDIKKVISY